MRLIVSGNRRRFPLRISNEWNKLLKISTKVKPTKTLRRMAPTSTSTRMSLCFPGSKRGKKPRICLKNGKEHLWCILRRFPYTIRPRENSSPRWGLSQANLQLNETHSPKKSAFSWIKWQYNQVSKSWNTEQTGCHYKCNRVKKSLTSASTKRDLKESIISSTSNRISRCISSFTKTSRSRTSTKTQGKRNWSRHSSSKRRLIKWAWGRAQSKGLESLNREMPGAINSFPRWQSTIRTTTRTPTTPRSNKQYPRLVTVKILMESARLKCSKWGLRAVRYDLCRRWTTTCLTTSESEAKKRFQLQTMLVLAPSRNCVLPSPALGTVSTSPMARTSAWEDKRSTRFQRGHLHNPNSGRDQLPVNLLNCHPQAQSRESTGRKNMVHR